MPKITIERETLQQVLDAVVPISAYGRVGTKDTEQAALQHACEALRVAMAAQPATVDDHLKCGHHRSLAINSAETGEFLYCDLCDAKSRCRDAETMEEELRAALAQKAEPVAWVDDLSRPQPHCVTNLKYMSAYDVAAGVKYQPVYAAPPAPAAVPQDEKISAPRP